MGVSFLRPGDSRSATLIRGSCTVPPVDERRYEVGSPSAAGPIREQPRPLGLALLAGLVAAVVGGVVWGLVVKYSEYEVGVVA